MRSAPLLTAALCLLTLSTLLPSPSAAARLTLATRRAPLRPWLRLTSSVLTLREKGSLMVRIGKGTVVLGSSPSEVIEAAALCATEPLAQRCNEHTFENELERRRATLSEFWIDRDEVSVADYSRCVDAGQCRPPEFGAGAERFNRPLYPVSFVSYDDARDYCRFRRATLPREAEFERAARGRDGRAYPWGQLYNARVSNHGRLGVFQTDPSDGFAELAPVGSFPEGQSPEGVRDLAGNVAEWQADPYRERSSEAPPSDGEGAPRVVRGGSFSRGAAFIRGAARERAAPNARRPDIGLRCALRAQDSAP